LGLRHLVLLDLCLRVLCFFDDLEEVEEVEELEELEELELVDFIVLHLEAHFGFELDELKKLFKCPRDISVNEPVFVIFVILCLPILIILIIYKKILLRGIKKLILYTKIYKIN
jgi:hypothetical protein